MFITFEGVEGAGKSTQIQKLAERLSSEGHQVLTTHEPGEGPLGAALRQLVLHPPFDTNIDSRAELLIMLADRAQHVSQVIQPHLQKGGVVLCDRYTDSSLAYQGYGRGLNVQEIQQLNFYATDGLVPNVTLLLDVNPKVGLARQMKRNRMEAEALPFHLRVRQGFLTLAAADPDRVVLINGEQPIAAVHDEIWSRIAPLLSNK